MGASKICSTFCSCTFVILTYCLFSTIEVADVDAPARLKKELDTVLALQADLDTVDNALQATRVALSSATPTDQSINILSGLEASQAELKAKVEVLYSSLNVHESFPELEGIDLEFVRTLLMARDLKINIRKRAIGSFFEWDKLDQAAGGRDQALGEHQDHFVIPKLYSYKET